MRRIFFLSIIIITFLSAQTASEKIVYIMDDSARPESQLEDAQLFLYLANEQLNYSLFDIEILPSVRDLSSSLKKSDDTLILYIGTNEINTTELAKNSVLAQIDPSKGPLPGASLEKELKTPPDLEQDLIPRPLQTWLSNAVLYPEDSLMTLHQWRRVEGSVSTNVREIPVYRSVSNGGIVEEVYENGWVFTQNRSSTVRQEFVSNKIQQTISKEEAYYQLEPLKP